MATQSELAKHLDLSTRRVQHLLERNVLPKAKGRGGLDIDKCRLAYISYLRSVAAAHRSEDGELDLTEERAKLARAQTETADLKNALARSEQLPADEVRAFWAKQVIATKSRIRALTHEIKGAIPHLTPEEVEEVRRLVNRTQSDLADGVPPDAVECGEGDEGALEATA